MGGVNPLKLAPKLEAKPITKSPDLYKQIKPNELKSYYWLKAELIDFCRDLALPASGSKLKLEKQIEIYLSSGLKVKSPTVKVNGARDSRGRQPIPQLSPIKMTPPQDSSL